MKGLFGALFAPGASAEAKLSSADLGRLLAGGAQSRSGVTVSWQTALQVTTVLACARVIAEGVSQVPWKVHQGDPGGRIASDHPVHELLHHRPNPWQTAFEFRETLALHVVLTGNGFARKLRVGRDRTLRSLEPVTPGEMRFTREPDGRIRYWQRRKDGDEVELDPAEIWHLRGPSWDSWSGLDVTRLAREAIGLSIATESAHAAMHKGGARISGTHTVNNALSKEQFDFLSAWIDRHAPGGDREGKPLILDNGAKFEAGQMTGVDAQHIETRKLQVEEICRAMRVMPIMVGQADKSATYASAEQMFLAHVVHTLGPWYERFEKSANVNLLSAEDRAAGYYTKFNANALMRGAAKDRAEFYAKALGAGGTPAWMTQDEVRAKEDLDPHGGPAGELSTGAMNAGARPGPTDPSADPDGDPGKDS